MERNFFLGPYLIWVTLLLGQLHGYKSCVEEERNALLEIKKYIISITREEVSDYINVLPTWTYDTKSDCCLWEGVKCNRTSRRVTGIAFGTLYLKENSLLNLSLLHPFQDVRSLNLSKNEDYDTTLFSGMFDDVLGYKSLSRLRNLEILDLSDNQFNNSIFPFLNSATSLKTLFLRFNHIDGPFPVEELKDFTNLELLDLSENKLNGSIPTRVLPAMRKLKALDLSGNEFSATMGLQGICEMTNMQELDLGGNNLVGPFPLCLTGLTGLRVLDLSSNNLTGKLPSSLGNLGSLEYLSLIDNNFEHLFSLGWLANLSELRFLRLGSRSKSFHVESQGSWRPKFQLSVIELSSCNLVEVPNFLLFQKDLNHIDLSGNKISGVFPHWLLANNTKLEVLFLQNNSLTRFQLPKSAHNLGFLDVSANDFNDMFPKDIGWVLPHLTFMKLSDNCFQGYLPSSLGNMERMEYLDISNNSFHGKLPSLVMSCYSMTVLILSHNQLSGEVFPESVNCTIWELSMDNNLFTGKIGQGLRNMKYLQMLDLSNNRLTGVILSWIGELAALQALLLSNNSLEGKIPISLFNLFSIELLDLSSNILSGRIPPYVISSLIGPYITPVVLLFGNNNLTGVIPDTLLKSVSVLDLRNNRLSGSIPEFSNTQHTHTLIFRGNILTGIIPRQLCGLPNLQLLDLATNRLKGSIPPCFSNTSFASGKHDQDYGSFEGTDYGFSSFSSHEQSRVYFKSLIMQDPFSMGYMSNTQIKIKFATKHRYDTYFGGNLELLYGLDLSDNDLSGDILADMGGLLELQCLNLSHNKLSGSIPESFSGLKNVESLDLSFNRLQGRIPSQLTELSSLAVFNVSFNNLSGVIPQGNQFNTIGTQSYFGNPFVCGQSINTSCHGSKFQEPDNGEEADESVVDMVSFYWSLAGAYVTILLGICSSLFFDSPWIRFWFYLVDAFIHKAKSFLW